MAISSLQSKDKKLPKTQQKHFAMEKTPETIPGMHPDLRVTLKEQ